MRNSGGGLVLRVLIFLGLGVLALYLIQGGYLILIGYLLKNNQAGVPNFSSTQVTGMSFATTRPPGHVGDGFVVGDMALYVTGMIRPAGAQVAGASQFKSLASDEEFLVVEISVSCRSANTSCRMVESDFGVRSASGNEYSAEFSTGFSGLNGLFEGGEIAAGQNMSGSVIFAIRKDDRGLVFFYPRFFGFGGNSASFLLGPH